jgi:hypothetical protein
VSATRDVQRAIARPSSRDDRDQHDDEAEDEQHMVVAANQGRTAILTRGQLTVCALVHKTMGRRELSGWLGDLL